MILHQLRQAHKGDGDIADIAGQPGKQRRAADLLYLFNLGIEMRLTNSPRRR